MPIGLIFCLLPLYAQRKEISQVRQNLKAGSNLPQSEQTMMNLLKDSANHCNTKFWLLLFETVKKQYEQANEKLYLKQQFDTSHLFIPARKLFLVLEGLDSIDAQLHKKGEVKPRYRKKHSSYLKTYRPNIYNGGLFFVRKQNFPQAYDFFDTYIDCAQQPLFQSYRFMETDTLIPHAAYMTVYCGYKQGDVEKTLKYVDLAQKDTANLNYLYQYLAEIYKIKGDTATYISTLQKGFEQYPLSLYFFPRLFDYWMKENKNHEALKLCDKALASDSTSIVFSFAKSSVLLRLKRYDECIGICDDLISQNDTIADAYLNAGLAYYNQALEIEKSSLSKKRRQQTLKLYKCAMPYLQRFRLLVPEKKNIWGMPLYTIYLNLNMGKEFEEMDKLMKKE